jgi:hypothetical protein
VDRKVTGSGKNPQGDITGLCGSWGSVSAASAIAHIENGTHRYYVEVESPAVMVRVVSEGTTKYLRTAADSSGKNNLDNLPDC